jgi:SH3-like domain-containing protein
VTEAIVRRVRTGGLGGKTVWLRDGRGRSFYYAHLDSQMVRRGTRVQPGDTLGLVGNTGNARTTPPHLHFGIYQRGPVDPYPFVHEPPVVAASITADTSRFGRWSRVAAPRANLRGGPTTASPVRRVLPQHTALRLVGSSGGWHRVRLPDGTDGFIAASLLRSADTALRTASFARATIRHRPAATAAVTDSLNGEAVGVHGRFGEFVLIKRAGRTRGWVQDVEDEAEAAAQTSSSRFSSTSRDRHSGNGHMISTGGPL